MQSGKYYLIVRNIETNEKIQIELTDRQEDRYCTTLSYVDYLTTQFINKDQLIKRLYSNKYINFKNADIYIEYNHNGLRFEEVIYKDMENLPKMVDSESTIDKNNEEFKKASTNYFNEINKRNVRNYVLNSPKINSKIKEHITEYYKNEYVRDGEFFKEKIIDDLTVYKTFRDLKFVIDEFYNIEKRKANEDRNNLRMSAKLIEYKPEEVKPEVKEEQLEFAINNNEIQLPQEQVKPQSIEQEINPYPTQTYEDAKAWMAEGKDVKEMIDLDDLETMPTDELEALGVKGLK